MPRFAWRVAGYPALWRFVIRHRRRAGPGHAADGWFVDDFHFVKGERILHVVNALSPAATASLAIGERIVGQVATTGG